MPIKNKTTKNINNNSNPPLIQTMMGNPDYFLKKQFDQITGRNEFYNI